MTQMIIYPVIIPLVTAILSILFRNTTKIRDYISITGSLAYLAVVGIFAFRVVSEGAVSYQAGGWAAPFGITLVADSLSVLMLLMTALVALAANIYSWGCITSKGKESGYYAFLHFMITGMSGAFITGDIFNLFVMFELVLMSSYALVAYSGNKESLFISLKYVVLNLIGSSLMLVSIGGIYSVTGTLNMAHLAQILSQGSVNTAPILGLSALLFCVFAIKSGLVPFHFWAPPVYSNSPPPASALMAGISKKVGIYAVIRLYVTIFSAAQIPKSAFIFSGSPITIPLGVLAGLMASVTVLVGGLGALNRKTLDKLLSYSSIGQMGFIYVALAITIIKGSQSALISALVYMIGHALAKPALFMVSGIIEKAAGTSKIAELGGLSEQSKVLSGVFLVSGLSLVGIPPLFGFFAKFLVFESVLLSITWLSPVLVIGAVTTLLYVSRTWLQVFFGPSINIDKRFVSRKELVSVIFLAFLIVVLGVQFELVYHIVESAASSAFDTDGYIETVLGESNK